MTRVCCLCERQGRSRGSPLADKKVELFGTWCGIDTAKSASVVQAVKEMVGNKARVIFAKGCNLTNEPMLAKASGLKVDPVENTRLVKEAVEQVKDADRIIAVMGEPNTGPESLQPCGY